MAIPEAITQFKGKVPLRVAVNLKVKSVDLIMFTTQLSVMLESGVVLSDGLDAIASQIKPGIFKMVVDDIADQIRNGESFSNSLSKYPKIFDSMFTSMVKASEASGKMPEMLDVLSGYMDAEEETRKQVKSAMIYPFIMMLMAVAATGTLMLFVLPKFSKIYESRGAALPKLTQMLVSTSQALSNIQIMATFITFVVVGGFGYHYWSKTLGGRKAIDFLKVHTPIFRTMFIDAVLTRSMRIMATMVNTGVNLLDAINVMQSSCDNYYFHRLWAETDRKIRDGYQLSDSIVLAPYSELVAPGIIQMLRAGEKSGRLGQVCDKISVFYEKKLQASIKNATALIEPLMITIMGCVIGTIAIALLLPIFRISSVMSR